MEQNIRFGLVLDRLAVMKILDWAVKYATFEGNFFRFSWAIFFLIFKKYCSVGTKKLNSIKVRKKSKSFWKVFYFGLK